MIYIMLTAMRPLVIQHDPVARQPNSVPTLLRRYWSVKGERRILPRHLRDEIFVVRSGKEEFRHNGQLVSGRPSPGPLTRKYEDFLRGPAKATGDNAGQKDEFDFVEPVSAAFPIQALVRLVNGPVKDTGMLIGSGNQMIDNTDPDYSEHLITDPDSDQYKHLSFGSPAALEVSEYGRGLARQRKGKHGADLISILVNRRRDAHQRRSCDVREGSPHLCLGSALARMKIRLMFIELIPRLVSIDLNGEVTRVRSNFVNGIKKFPVRVHPLTPEVEH